MAEEKSHGDGPTTPEKITLRWLSEHVSIGVWAALITVVVAFFSAGVVLGEWTPIRLLLGRSPIEKPAETSPDKEPQAPILPNAPKTEASLTPPQQQSAGPRAVDGPAKGPQSRQPSGSILPSVSGFRTISQVPLPPRPLRGMRCLVTGPCPSTVVENPRAIVSICATELAFDGYPQRTRLRLSISHDHPTSMLKFPAPNNGWRFVYDGAHTYPAVEWASKSGELAIYPGESAEWYLLFQGAPNLGGSFYYRLLLPVAPAEFKTLEYGGDDCGRVR